MKALAVFLKRRDIEISVKCYGIDTLVTMAQGLFCSLLVGTIINTIDAQLHLTFLTSPAATITGTGYTVGGFVSVMSGPAMATTIGWALRYPSLVLFSLITVGFASNTPDGAGGPPTVLLVAILVAKAGKAVSKETRVDVLVTPLVTITVGPLSSVPLAPALDKAAMKVGGLVVQATRLQPFPTGILVSFVVDIVLTLLISSTTTRMAFGLTGLVGGTALAGCCTQMVGFAMISYPEDGFGSLVSQGIGTSVLQMGNIVRNPKAWIVPCVTSVIAGPIATCVFHLQQNDTAVVSGVGTCGLVGSPGVYTDWVKDTAAERKVAITGMDWLGMLLVVVILPAIFCPLIHAPVHRMGPVKDGDLRLT